MLDELSAQYLRSLSEKIVEIKRLVGEYREGNEDAGRQIRSVAHALHGSGATFGYPAISEAAREVEHAEEADLIRKLTLLVKALKDTLEQASTIPTANDKQAAPAPPEPEPKPEPEPPKPADPKKQRILLVDDDVENCNLLRDQLTAQHPDLDVVAVGNAAKAMDLLLRQRFALVVLDLILPDRDGREVLRDMKYEFKINTPVYVLSAVSKDVVRIECMGLGAERFFIKPYDPAELVKAINQLLKSDNSRDLKLVPLGEELRLREARQAEAAKAALLGKAILVAEDDPMQAKLIRERLGQEGLKVEVAENGRRALELHRSKAYALLILDVDMPLIDGFEVLRQVRGGPANAGVPVILLTAMGSEKDIIRGYDLGANDYILKPYSPVQLIARVKTLLKPASA